jgi:single-strand DNA-binding protein
MAGLNIVHLIGNTGSDPELRYTPAGDAVASVNLATNEQWTSKEGNKQERTEWHRLVFWRKLAETVAQYAKKGRQLYVSGRLQTRSWEDKDGVKRYTTEIVVRNMQLLGPSAGNGSRPESQPGYAHPAETSGQPEEPIQIPEDDIPF